MNNQMMMLVNMMIQSNPQLRSVWNQAIQMAKGKTPEQGNEMIHNLAKQMNLNLDDVEKQANSMISQFVNNQGN